MKKNQHYRAEMYLEGFVNDKKQVEVLDKTVGKMFPSHIRNICPESHFFSFDENQLSKEEILSLENALADYVEPKVASILKLIRVENNLEAISPEDFSYLLEWMAWIYVADPTNKEGIDLLCKYYTGSKLFLTNSDKNAIFLEGFKIVSPYFLNRYWELCFIAEDEGSLFTSDRSINLMGETLDSPVGLATAPIIFFPLSPQLLLVGLKVDNIVGFSRKSKQMSKDEIIIPNLLAYAKARRFVIGRSLKNLDPCLIEANIKIMPEVTFDSDKQTIKIINR